MFSIFKFMFYEYLEDGWKLWGESIMNIMNTSMLGISWNVLNFLGNILEYLERYYEFLENGWKLWGDNIQGSKQTRSK